MIKLIAIIAFLISPFTRAESSKSESENMCLADANSLDTGDVFSDYLLMLYVDFNDQDKKDTKGRSLRFTPEKIELEGNHLHFTNPKINGELIHAYQSTCMERAKNFLGYEVCRDRALQSIASTLCSQLGLDAPDQEFGGTTYINSDTLRHDRYYSLEENGDWYKQYNSMLAGRSRFPTLHTFSCKIP